MDPGRLLPRGSSGIDKKEMMHYSRTQMIKQAVVWTSGLFQAFMFSGIYGPTFFLPIYFQAINNVTAMLSGVYLLPTILPQILIAGLSGVLCEFRIS